MIIKSLSRKEPTFGQLIDYIVTEADDKHIYSRNLYTADLKNTASVRAEFQENFTCLKRQKNSNALYHEVISISKAEIDIEKQKESLLEIVDEYVKARAKNCLVYGRIHEADNNLHLHIVISSNEVGKTKNHYVTKKEFSEIKKGLEKYVLEKYPELSQKIVINKTKREDSVSVKEFELKKRTGKMTKRESMQYRLTQIFNSSSTREQFIEKLRADNIEIYIRGKNIGFIDLSDDKKRKYRLNKLGLSKEFNKMSENVAQDYAKTNTRKTSSSAERSKSEVATKGTEKDVAEEKKKEPVVEKNQAKTEIVQEDKVPLSKEQEAIEELKKIRSKKNITNTKKM